MTGLPLLDWHPPFVRTSDTSKQAARRIKPRAENLREKLFHFYERHPGGLTDEEAQNLSGISASTQRPRRVELVQAGRLEDSGQKRATASGSMAVVWRVKP